MPASPALSSRCDLAVAIPSQNAYRLSRFSPSGPFSVRLATSTVALLQPRPSASFRIRKLNATTFFATARTTERAPMDQQSSQVAVDLLGDAAHGQAVRMTS